MIAKLIFGAAFAACALGPAYGQAAPASQPPNCAAIAFRPILTRSGDGVQDAGLYKSRFGRIEVKATVTGGVAQNYFVEINGKPLTPIAAPLPAAIATCAQAKRLAPPISAEPVCAGDQITVLIEHSSDQRYVLLYVHRAAAWRFCSVGID